MKKFLLDNIAIIVSSLLTIVGFIITNHSISKQFKNDLRKKNIDELKVLYCDCLTDLSEVILKPGRLLDYDYLNSLLKYSSKLKLFAPKTTAKTYATCVTELYKWAENNKDKLKQLKDFDIVDELSADLSAPWFSDTEEFDAEAFLDKRNKLMKKMIPTMEFNISISDNYNTLIDEMRKDIGVDCGVTDTERRRETEH